MMFSIKVAYMLWHKRCCSPARRLQPQGWRTHRPIGDFLLSSARIRPPEQSWQGGMGCLDARNRYAIQFWLSCICKVQYRTQQLV